HSAAEQEIQMQAYSKANELVKDALQLDDDLLREATLHRLRADMLSGDPVTVRAALFSFSRLQELDFDKASYREAILPHVSSDDVQLRAAAAFALYHSGMKEGDAEMLREAVRRGLGESATSLLLWMEKGDLTG